MADLDDFFAKKDKKKPKGKPKFLTAEELVKNLEDTTKRETPVVKPKKGETTSAVPSSDVSGDSGSTKGNEEEIVEEEWKEFEEEQRKDYTGLKIGQLTINDDNEQSGGENYDEDGESENKTNSDNSKRSGGGPWKKVIPAEEVTQIPIPETEKKVYVSPAFRHSQALTSGSKLKSRKTAPDITNADYFPTLGAARPEEQRKKKNEPAFEEVRHGGRVQRVQENATAPVSGTNRFQSLDEDDS